MIKKKFNKSQLLNFASFISSINYFFTKSIKKNIIKYLKKYILMYV